jgi:hypothetical protein
MLSIAAGIWNTSKIYNQRGGGEGKSTEVEGHREVALHSILLSVDGGGGRANLICSVCDGRLHRGRRPQRTDPALGTARAQLWLEERGAGGRDL